jgi:2-polyprenyl-3-methyl-5-hydroxy-6-metoxy-1,4-benzoquinol methylase/spore coat polysaccharide biosynthesis predicted glycosyltransferase SpsG
MIINNNNDSKTDMNRQAVLVVPCCEPGRGGGHLTRSIALVCGLRALGRESWLYIPASANEFADKGGYYNPANFNKDWLITPSTEGDDTGLQNINWECIVLDRFRTPPKELSRWTNLAPVIGIDEGGSSRKYFDFLIDILPNCESIKPNLTDTSLLPLPAKPSPKNTEPSAPFKILVSFGREDAAGLGLVTAQTLEAKNISNIEITLLHGGQTYSLLSTPHSPPITNSSIPILNEYDLLITHYGLTAFEALYADVPVLLVSPSAYHEKLAKAAGFCSLGAGKDKVKKLPGLLFSNGEINQQFLEKLKNRCTSLTTKFNLNHAPQQNLAALVKSYVPNLSRNCPVCGTMLCGPVIARFPERSYYRCKSCGVIGMSRLNPAPIEYGKKYFFDMYQKQYGKTYIEDFPNLIAMGKRRLALIRSLLSSSKIDDASDNKLPHILDIGCAYGPFLAAAKEEGFSPFGIDPAEDAVRYVTQTLNIPAVQGYFPSSYSLFTFHCSLFTVITLWFVIEHFCDCVPVLAEIRKLLKPGGVLAFATPSYSGVSGRRSLRHFLEHSPVDHWTIWSPLICKKALSLAGYKVKKIVNTGHHPERFPLFGKYAQNKKSPLYKMLLAISSIFSLGDTFEVYAISE